MEWSDIGRTVSKIAPVVGTFLGGPIGGAAGALLATLFGVENTPEEVEKVLRDPDSLLKLKKLETEIETTVQVEATKRMEAVNHTIQAEIKSGKKSWRDYYGYLFVSTSTLFLLSTLLVGLVYFFSNNDYSRKMDTFMSIWGVTRSEWVSGFGVLGVVGVMRSIDKKTAKDSPSMLSKMIKKLT